VVIARWSPFPEFDLIERRMRRMLEDAGIAPAPLPAADVYETDGEYVVELEVPGFDRKQLTVELTDHTLCVKGERVDEKEEKGKEFRLQERLAKHFERRFVLPTDADATKLAAAFEDGVLTVRAPKEAPADTPVTVEIASK
jgi:HSP20 family protein